MGCRNGRSSNRRKQCFSDWYTWEHQGKVKNGDTSDIACGSWENLDRDLEAVKALGVKAYRFSVEWARIEPKINRFDDSVLEDTEISLRRLLRTESIPFSLSTISFFLNGSRRWEAGRIRRTCVTFVASSRESSSLWRVHSLLGHCERTERLRSHGLFDGRMAAGSQGHGKGYESPL